MDFKKKRWIFIVLNAISYSAIWTFPYMIETYYIPVQSAFGFSNAQIGSMMSLFGIASALMYFPGGIIADKFSLKKLLIVSYVGTGILGSITLLIPPLSIMLIIQLCYGITCVLTLWAAIMKFLRVIADDDELGKIYGSFFALAGLFGAIMGFGGTALYNYLGQDVDAFKALVLFYVICVSVPGIIFAFTFNEKETLKNNVSVHQRITLKQLKEIFKMPIVWILVGFVYFSFIPKSAMTYFQPYMSDFYGASVAWISVVAIIRVQIIRLVISPLAGIITDKIRSSTLTLIFAVVIGIIASLLVLLTPHDPKLLILVVISLFLFAAMYNICISQSFIPLGDAKIPVEHTGTIIGIVSVIGYSSDIFYYNIAGRILDAQGAQGYNTIFMISLVCSALALVFAIILRRAVKKTREKNEMLEMAK